MMQKHLFAFGAIAGLALASTVASATTITCVKTSYGSTPQDGSLWSDGLTPDLKNDYLVNANYLLTTGEAGGGAQITFTGGSLTVGGNKSNSGFVIVGKNGTGTTTFPCGITVYDATKSTVNITKVNVPPYNCRIIKGVMTLSSDYVASPQFKAGFRSENQICEFADKIVGDATTGICFFPNADAGYNENTNDFVRFTGDLSEFKGTITLAANKSAQTTVLALGSVTFAGTVNLAGGSQSLVRTVSASDVATVAALDMSANSALYPEIDLRNQCCGTIKVTGTYTASGTHPVCARFLQGFRDVGHDASRRYAILTVPTSAGTLRVEDFTLVPMDAVDAPEDAFALSVDNDGNGDPTLYLTVASFEKLETTVLVKDGTYGADNCSGFLEAHADYWNPAGAPQPGFAYDVVNDKKLYTPYFQPVVTTTAGVPGEDIHFRGDVLTLGDAMSAGYLYHQAYARVFIPKLVVNNGTVYYPGAWSGNRHTWLNADIEIRATEYAKARFVTAMTWQHIYLEGKLTGSADAKMCMENAHGTAVDLGIASDCNAYYGSILVKSSNAGVTPNFYFSSTNLPGTLVIGESTASTEGSVALFCTNGCRFANLTVNRSVNLAASVDSGSWASKPIVIDASFVQNAPITIALSVTGGDPMSRTDNLDAAFIPVVKVKKTIGRPDMEKIRLGSFTGLGKAPADMFELRLDDAGDPDYYVIGLDKHAMRYLVRPDDTKMDLEVGGVTYTYTARTSFDMEYLDSDPSGNAGRLPGWNWNVNERPSYAYDYYIRSTLRSHSAPRCADSYFQGRRLYIVEGGVIHQSNSITVTNLYLISGTINHAHNGGATRVYEGTDLATIKYTRSVYGTAHVIGDFTFQAPCQSDTNCLRIACDLLGGAGKMITVKKNSNGGHMAYSEIGGDNSAFAGVLRFSDGNTTLDDDHRHVVLVRSAKNLGGEPAAFAYNGLTIQDQTSLRPLGSWTFSSANRGVFVNGVCGVENAAGEIFTCDATLVYKGLLTKRGAGTVRFARPPKFLQSDDKTVGDLPVETNNRNVLLVKAGAIGVCGDPLACDGVKIRMAEGARLDVRIGDVATTGETALGLKNVKATTPFSLEGADGKLHVSFDAAALDRHDPAGRTVAICTVTDTVAESLRDKIVLKRPRGFSARLEKVSLESGTVTFRAQLLPSGMMVIVK